MFALVALAPLLLGLFGFAVLSANYYHTQAQTEGFWSNIKWYFGTLGGLTTKAKTLFSQVISNWMAQAVQATDAHVATTFHYLASEVKAAADITVQFSAFALTVAQAVTGQVSWGEVSSALKQLRATIRVAEHKAQAATEAAIRQEKAAVRSVAQGVYPRLRGLEHDVTRTIPKEIHNLREHVKTLEDDAVRSARWLKAHEKSLAATTFAGAVAWALSHLGLGWLRCNSNPFNNNRNACGLWSILGRVLGLAAFLTAAFDFPEFVKAAELVAEGIGTAIADVEGVFPLKLDPLPPPG